MAKRKKIQEALKPANRAVFFDFDGTWLRRQSFYYWVICAEEFGLFSERVGIEARDRYRAYREREIKHTQFMEYLVETVLNPDTMDGISVELANRIAELVILRYGKLTHQFTERISQSSQKAGYRRVIVTGALHEVVQAFCLSRGIEDIYATRFPQRDERLIGHGQIEWVGRKGDAVEDFARRNDIDLAESVAIGDTERDASMLCRVGYPICINPCEELEEIARKEEWPIVMEWKGRHGIFRSDRHGSLMDESPATIFPSKLVNHFYR